AAFQSELLVLAARERQREPCLARRAERLEREGARRLRLEQVGQLLSEVAARERQLEPCLARRAERLEIDVRGETDKPRGGCRGTHRTGGLDRGKQRVGKIDENHG